MIDQKRKPHKAKAATLCCRQTFMFRCFNANPDISYKTLRPASAATVMQSECHRERRHQPPHKNARAQWETTAPTPPLYKGESRPATTIAPKYLPACCFRFWSMDEQHDDWRVMRVEWSCAWAWEWREQWLMTFRVIIGMGHVRQPIWRATKRTKNPGRRCKPTAAKSQSQKTA